LLSGHSVIVANTFSTNLEMWAYRGLAKTYGATIQVIEVCGDFGSIHNIPEAVIAKMRARWEPLKMED
jgi:hypothetical protein